MNVSDILALTGQPDGEQGTPDSIGPEASLPEALDALCRSRSTALTVRSEDAPDSAVTQAQMLAALAHLLYYDPEYSELTLRCTPSQYSASTIARAVEDADATLVSLLCSPAPQGLLDVWLRINRTDPSLCARSLERYGYSVSSATGPRYADRDISRERITALQHYLNI